MTFPARRNEKAKRSDGYPTESPRIRRVKARIDSQLRKSPRLHGFVRWIWTTAKWLILSCKCRVRALFASHVIKALDIDKTLWLSPRKLVYCTSGDFGIYDFKGAVKAGDWDRSGSKFEDLDVFVAFKEVFMEGKSWPQTVFYQRIQESLKTGGFLYGCADQNALQDRCNELEDLFRAIKYGGYKSQRELHNLAADDEVTISIGRDGDLLFSGGAHRLAIAKLLGIEKIPVRVAVRHLEWIAFVEKLLSYSGRFDCATHPDLRNLPTLHNCEDRFKMIKHNMSVKGGRLLDLGPNLGYFCHRFEDEGFECYAVENSKEVLYFLETLRRAENKKFKIVPKPIYEWPQVDKMRFDVVLAMNVFDHALKTKHSYSQLTTLLQRVKGRELFFETPNDSQMRDAYRKYTPSEFAQFIIRNSKFKKATVIGKTVNDTTMYRLS